MKYENYKIQIQQNTHHLNVFNYEGYTRQINPNDHRLISQSFVIVITWEEVKQTVSSPDKHRVTFTSSDEMSYWINDVINDTTRSDDNTREFIKWLEMRLSDIIALERSTK